jgi:7-carboxy-7-deazaguanine synthase
MLVSEIFHSIQGEGLLTGTPSVFVRTSGCNLRCNWCDTPYASWYPEGDNLSVENIVARVLEFPSRHVVLTGGEPMIAREIHDLAGRLREAGRHVTIETAATVAPEGIACDLASLSPKLSNSAPDDRLSPAWRQRHEELRLQPAIIREWLKNYPYQLKFVVARQEDLAEIESLIALIDHPIPTDRVLLMPEGVDEATLKERTSWLTEICRERGYHFCARLHIALYGNVRGT